MQERARSAIAAKAKRPIASALRLILPRANPPLRLIQLRPLAFAVDPAKANPR